MTNRIRVLLALLVASIGSVVQADHHHQPIALIGVWKATASTDDGSREVHWTFAKKDGKLTGEVARPN